MKRECISVRVTQEEESNNRKVHGTGPHSVHADVAMSKTGKLGRTVVLPGSLMLQTALEASLSAMPFYLTDVFKRKLSPSQAG